MADTSEATTERHERPRHPIRVVATRTGLTPSALRAWERRYGVVDPARSDGGQRLYSDDDIERLSLLKRVTDAGRSIGDVAELPMEEVRRLAREDEEARRTVARMQRHASPEPVADLAADVRERAMEAVEELDSTGLEGVLRRGAAALGGIAFMEEVLSPLMRDVGERWVAGTLRPAHEHMASGVVRRVLTWLSEASATDSGPSAVMGTLPGEPHELGAMFAATTATLEGWSVTYLGADLPAEDIAEVAERVEAEVVGLSVALPPNGVNAVEALQTLRRLLPPDVVLLLGGGQASEMLERLEDPGVRRITDLVGLRDTLREVRNGNGGG